MLQIGDSKIVITTDYLNANPISKQLGFATYWDMGRLLVAANISDLLGSGALPVGFVASIMMEKSSSDEDFRSLMDGVKYELNNHNTPLIGGDTKLGKSNAFCGTAIGIEQLGGKLFIKNAAKPDQIIWVSGLIGNAGAAVHGLSAKVMDDNWNQWARNTLTIPSLPFHKSIALAKQALGKAGTDISDGLGENLYDLCETSSIGATIYAEKIPIDDHVVQLANQFNIPPWFYAFSIGGDFQFIVTTNEEDREIVGHLGFHEIGITTTSKDLVISSNNNVSSLPRLGHTDFNTEGFAVEVQMMLKTLKVSLNDQGI
ncbi:hypothetical protein B0919_06050 [Hymenobacter sp. CRA2]|nr:hypothetical protein B0919_06050 [Hymenobacter sp. CRA2]